MREVELREIQNSFLIDQTKVDIHIEALNGACIGGFVDLQSLNYIAYSYLITGEKLIDFTNKNKDIAYEYAYPIIFIYRHALEIKLKTISVHYKKDHSFGKLLPDLLSLVGSFMSDELKKKLSQRINEFILLDNESTRFRYGSEPKDEYLIDLDKMGKVVKEIFLIIDTIKAHQII